MPAWRCVEGMAESVDAGAVGNRTGTFLSRNPTSAISNDSSADEMEQLVSAGELDGLPQPDGLRPPSKSWPSSLDSVSRDAQLDLRGSLPRIQLCPPLWSATAPLALRGK